MSEKKVVGRNVAIALGIICIVLVASLVGAIANYTSIIATRDSQISTLTSENNQLQTWLNGNITYYQWRIASLQTLINSLNALISNLNDTIDSLTKYFFVQDPNFTTPLDKNVFWGVEAWNKNPDSICEVRNGTLHLFYNETIGNSYGNSGVSQGTHTYGYGARLHQLLVGDSPENAYNSDCVIFPKNMQTGKFWLETKFRIMNVSFNCYPTVYDPRVARVNLGLTLMCAINNLPLNQTGQNLWLDIYFAGYSLPNKTNIWLIPKDANYVDQTGDIHAGYFVGEVPQKDFGNWISMQIDLGDYINKTLNLITKIDIKTIRVYGFILFVECLGAYAEVEYAFVNTVRK